MPQPILQKLNINLLISSLKFMELPISLRIKSTFSICQQLLLHYAHNIINLHHPLYCGDVALKPTAMMAIAMMATKKMFFSKWKAQQSDIQVVLDMSIMLPN